MSTFPTIDSLWDIREHMSIAKFNINPNQHVLCYCSMLFDEAQLTELRVLGASIDATGARRFQLKTIPKIAMVTIPDVQKRTIDILEKDNWTVVEVEKIINPDAPKRWEFEFTKLQMFSLHHYGCEKVAYLDADTMLIRNPTPTFAKCPGFCATMKHSDRFNAGVLVLTPGEDIYKQVTSSFRTVETYEGGDQGMLNSLYPNMADAPAIGTNSCNNSLTVKQARLPPGFNADIAQIVSSHRWAHAGGNHGQDSVFIIHYTMSWLKPSMSWTWWIAPDFQAYGWYEYAGNLYPRISTGIPIVTQAVIAVILYCIVMAVITKYKTDWTKLSEAKQSNIQKLLLSALPSFLLAMIVFFTPLQDLPVNAKNVMSWSFFATLTHIDSEHSFDCDV